MVGHKCDIFVAKVASPVCVLPKRGMVWKVSFYRQTRESPVTVETNSNSFEWLLFPASFFLFWLALSLHGFLLQLDQDEEGAWVYSSTNMGTQPNAGKRPSSFPSSGKGSMVQRMY